MQVREIIQLKGGTAKDNVGVSNLSIQTVFEHNKGAMAYLDKGVNHITVTFDNPQDFASGAALRVVYTWKEYDGSGWNVARTHEQYVTDSPSTFTITTGGTAPSVTGSATGSATAAQTPGATQTITPTQDVRPEITASIPIGVAAPGGNVSNQATAAGRGSVEGAAMTAEQRAEWTRIEAAREELARLAEALKATPPANPPPAAPPAEPPPATQPASQPAE